MTEIRQQITNLVAQQPDIEVAWLYGSRATGTATSDSDYDLAIAFRAAVATSQKLELLDNLEYALNSELNKPISLVDINTAPVPLAKNIVTQGIVLVCVSDFRLRAEEQRIWSLWEAYKFEHEHNRKAL